MSVRVACPSCGGPVVFEVGSSMVAVCSYCRSVVARGDRSVEDLGKVAALVDSGAILKVGMTGKYRGVGYRLTGRMQLAHAAGGVWDEWYAAFDDTRWGWLAEAQGRYYLTFEQPDATDLPPFEQLKAGDEVRFREDDRRFVVGEVGTAKTLGAEGEIPFRFTPNAEVTFADLSGPGTDYATIDYTDDEPVLYLGQQVTPDDLGVPANLRREAFELRQVGAKKVNCPNCGGPLELRAPDRTERVGCPFCGSLLDATRGDLTLLKALEKPAFELAIPIGTKGTFGTDERTVIGAVQRAVIVDGAEYDWQEYLLYHPRDGFEWLTCENGHWNRVKNIPAGEVNDSGTNSAWVNGRSYRRFQSGTAMVRGVVGECYWKVRVGEQSDAVDYIDPPGVLSWERSFVGGGQEVNWSVGEYLPPADVQKAFGLQQPLASPVGVAPNQPFPYKRVYRLAAWFIGALFLLGILFAIILPNRTVYTHTFDLHAPQPAQRPAALAAVTGAPINAAVLPPLPAPPLEKTQVFFSDLFELKGRRNLRVTVACPNLTGWMVVEGDVVQQSTGNVQPFVVPLAFYSGTEEGEAWAEGERDDSVYVTAQPGGQYSLRLEVERENTGWSGPLTVTVQQGRPHFKNWFLTLVGLSLIPIGVGIYHLIFNSRRWANSAFEPLTAGPPTGDTPAEPAAPIPLADAGETGWQAKRKKKGKNK